MLTWSCCSWTPDLEIHLWWGTENRGCWRYRKFLGSMVRSPLRAWPCWGSDLRVIMNIEMKDTTDHTDHHISLFLHINASCSRVLSYIHAVGRVDSLFWATPDPWRVSQATWSPWKNAPGQRSCHIFQYITGTWKTTGQVWTRLQERLRL